MKIFFCPPKAPDPSVQRDYDAAVFFCVMIIVLCNVRRQIDKIYTVFRRGIAAGQQPINHIIAARKCTQRQCCDHCGSDPKDSLFFHGNNLRFSLGALGNQLRPQSPGFVCRATVSKEAVQTAETDELIRKIYDGSADKLFAALLGRKKLSPEQLKALEQIIGQME